ncbi:hypothetical protein IE53DRAFT_288503 [Violaceomyces palustris]|uniref:Uncharacterized protein n=1 Tax=Violaceomyces palustris TaxID=1673888 RepID=A0ACD0NLZ9_9BASI|nr:hypothetical protein IE53DRAFT_288503 [Violaceomyces palustris]
MGPRYPPTTTHSISTMSCDPKASQTQVQLSSTLGESLTPLSLSLFLFLSLSACLVLFIIWRFQPPLPHDVCLDGHMGLVVTKSNCEHVCTMHHLAGPEPSDPLPPTKHKRVSSTVPRLYQDRSPSV